MPDEKRKTGSYPNLSTHTRTMEQKRSMLRKALVTRPDDPRIRQALLETLNPAYIKRSAGRGVFISYHRADEIFALELDNGLRTASVPVWLDTIDVSDGADWRNEVVAALRTCGLMLLILSKSWVEDDDVATEYQFFVDTGKIVLPILSEACDYSKINLLLSPVDFRRDRESGLRQLIKLLSQEVIVQ
jgi:hypothetical protein